MQEVIYNYYTDHYGGRVIPENEFSYVIKKAEMYLHSFTFNQLEGQPYDNIVKNCLCDMAEAIYKVEKQGDESIKKSESTDGYSVSYVTEIADGQNPQIIEVFVTLEKEEYMIIDSRDYTVQKYLVNGTVQNLFHDRALGKSIFEQLPSGLLKINWSGEFGFDLTLFLERREAKW